MSNSVLRFFHWIAALFRRERVPYEPIAVTFPAVDVLRYRSQLDLDNDGARNGSHNSPASESATFDIIEQRIVTAIESERNTAQEIYLSNLRAYGDRLRALQIHTLLQRAAVANEEARANFTDTGNAGRDRLFEHERTLRERSRELEQFRAVNGLARRSNRPNSRVLHVGLVAILWLTESIANGVFLARGLASGDIGGIVQAGVIAALNVGSGLFAGAFFSRRLNYQRVSQKMIGIAGLLLYASFVVVLNFAVAHYRDALGGPDPDNAPTLALRSLFAKPFQVADINSLFLLVMGIAFSLIGAFDGYRMDDSYPGYGRLFAICQQALDDFRDAKEEESNLLAELKDHIFDRLDRHTGDIESRRAAHHGVLQQRDGFRELFLRHLDHLEQAGNELLTCYRTANTNARNAPPPAHFSQRWIMAETEGQILASEDQSFAPFPDNEAARVLSQLEATRRDILRSYAEAQSHYTSVAEVVRGIPDHITAPSPEPAGSS